MATRPARESIRRRGGATYRLIRYADDFVVCVAGGREHAEALRTEVEQVLAPLGLRLSPRRRPAFRRSTTGLTSSDSRSSASADVTAGW